ncbi:unnamed protein product [Nippostrongylus brasiliensis]|uniref:Palmitoyltransferase n=1 Tax=Nippostrongylus brasiliensis TaxID=27835 RepID=A0A0N4YS00_NIPBR|nr:unnamed protein product [Nippostrongylus brasiliensis]
MSRRIVVCAFNDRPGQAGSISSSSEDDCPSDREAMMLRSRNAQLVGDIYPLSLFPFLTVRLLPMSSAFQGDWTMCTRCESFRPPRAHHCRVCRRCIRKMDHHCQFLFSANKCFRVERNVVNFTFRVMERSIHRSMAIVLYDRCSRLHSIFLSMESALFGMFVMAVSCDQLGAIFSEETAVEAVQRRTKQMYKRSRRRGRISLLKEVCGGGK